jgi:hypothetical protein
MSDLLEMMRRVVLDMPHGYAPPQPFYGSTGLRNALINIGVDPDTWARGNGFTKFVVSSHIPGSP